MIGKRIKKRYSYFLFAVLLGLGAFWVVKYFSDLNSSQELNEVKSTADEPSSDLAEYVAYQDGLILESKGKYSDDIRTILERGELLVGVLSEENEPFVIKERNGEFRGYCVDFARCLADKLGVRLTIDNSAETYDDLIRMAHDKKVELLVSPMTFSTASFLLRKHGSEGVRNLLSNLRQLLSVTTSDERTVDDSIASQFKDFEDAMQYYTVLDAKAEIIITRNGKDFTASNLPVMTATEYIANRITITK